MTQAVLLYCGSLDKASESINEHNSELLFGALELAQRVHRESPTLGQTFPALSSIQAGCPYLTHLRLYLVNKAAEPLEQARIVAQEARKILPTVDMLLYQSNGV